MWNEGNVSCKVGILTQPIVQEDIESIFKIVGDDLNRLRGKRVLITAEQVSSARGSWKRFLV